MSRKNGLSVEIFRDYRSLDPDSLSVDPLVTSVHGIGKIIGKFDILDTSKFLDVTTKRVKHIKMDNIFLDTESQPADINIVLTDRKLSHQADCFEALRKPYRINTRLALIIAIVSTYQNDLWAATTDHELGHNLNLPLLRRRRVYYGS